MSITSRYTFIQGLRTHFYAAGGHGGYVLLLHGGGTDSAALSWDMTAPVLAQSQRVIALDWPGYGSSDRPKIAYTQEFYEQFLIDFMDSMAIQKASLVGLSMGGAIALGCTLRWPERVEKLVLVDSYGLQSKTPAHRLAYLYMKTPGLSEITWSMMAHSRAMVRSSLGSLFSSTAAVPDSLVDQVYSEVCKPHAGRAFMSFQRSEAHWRGLRTVYMDKLEQIQAPTLLIHGEQDTLVPLACSQAAQARIPNSELRMINPAGHWPQREQPEAFNQILSDFLACTPQSAENPNLAG